MAERGGGKRHPKGHPNYYKQLARIKAYYIKKGEEKDREARQLGNEPGITDVDWWDDVELDDEEIELLEWEIEEEEKRQLYLTDKAVRERADAIEAERERDRLAYIAELEEEKKRKQTGEKTKEKAYTYQSEIPEHFKKKKQKGEEKEKETDNQPSTSKPRPGMEWFDDAPAQPGTDAPDGRGGGGGGPSGGGGGQNIESEMQFGKTTKPETRHFRKSFLVNIQNGKDFLKLTRTAPGVGSQTYIQWNEGWQIIPWADIRAYLTPMDYFQLALCRKWRIKRIAVKMEGIIPFQVDLSGATNSTTATFNNRINIHTYVDDGELLPHINPGVTATHSDTFETPWGEGTNNVLPSPDFDFIGAEQPSAYRYNTSAAFATGEPQRFFSLYNTGRVGSCYPGQKFTRQWVNKNTNWVGRSTNDNILKAFDYSAQTAALVDSAVNKFSQQAWRSGVTGQAVELKEIPGDVTLYTTTKSVYMDTGIPIKFDGPPYILVRVEPYPNLGTGGGLINIYAQAHLHYDMEVECIPMEKPMQYVPLVTGSVSTQGNAEGFQNQIYKDTAYGITDNKVHRVAGVADTDVIYT